MIPEVNWAKMKRDLKVEKNNVKRLTNENNGRDSRNERKTYFETPSKYNQ